MGIAERTLFYWQKQASGDVVSLKPATKSPPPNKLKPGERQAVLSALLRPTWSDFSPREIYYKLLDEEQAILASPATFYRIARIHRMTNPRTNISDAKKLNRETPHLIATAPNQVWSWDVSQIQSTRKLERFYLYVIIDIWSRFVVGWALETQEKTDHAISLWKKSLEDQAITGQGLINHKDNGAIMTAKEMIKFVRDVEMVDSYSRAGVSDDNPFSESLFRTIKYFRNYPEQFDSCEEGRIYFNTYFNDYNFSFHHSGIQFIQPAVRHYGEEEKILNKRNAIIQDFFELNKHRYSGKPKSFKPILAVNIN